jgi:phenazine biosynthesis protein phzE
VTGHGAGAALLARVLAGDPRPFALLHRPVTGRPDRVELLVGRLSRADRLADLPEWDDQLVMVPYRQVAERGFACHDDGTPLQSLQVLDRAELAAAEVSRAAGARTVTVRDGGFDLADAAYADLVRAVVAGEIGTGEGANFVLKRSFLAQVEDYSVGVALAVFDRLLRGESGAHWTFLVHTGERTLIGASPERHLTLMDGVATMNPISGTYRYPRTGVTLSGLLDFLADRKESDELYMVLDEELKMMGRVCTAGGQVTGPRLKPMARLAHTEYLVEGHSTLDVREILRETMFAPTVTGSPLENACRVIARYEHTGRGYYGGVLALVGRDRAGTRTLDSTIVIRTADVDAAGRLRVDVGATLVRHSDPLAEAAETAAKATTLLAAFGLTRPAGPGADPAPVAAVGSAAVGGAAVGGAAVGGAAVGGAAVGSKPAGGGAVGGRAVGNGAFGGQVARGQAPGGPVGGDGTHPHWSHPTVRRALERRNATMSGFWLRPPGRRRCSVPALTGRRALVVDCEDTFTFMLAHQLRALGLEVSVRRYDKRPDSAGADLVVLGPGPGDPRAVDDPKIATMRELTGRLLADGSPLLAVCLGHQVLCGLLGLDLVRRPVPNQGVQREVDLFGRRERCGFYNTYAAVSTSDEVPAPARGGTFSAAREPGSGQLHALRGPGLWSLQFHPESVLTENGVGILGEIATSLLSGPAAGSPADHRPE